MQDKLQTIAEILELMNVNREELICKLQAGDIPHQISAEGQVVLKRSHVLKNFPVFNAPIPVENDMQTRVLVVDDDTTILKSLHTFFSSIAWKTSVEYANTSDDALNSLSNNPPDILILDLQLDDKSGLDILDFMRVENLLETNIVILTGFLNRYIDKINKNEFPSLAFIQKPFRYSELREVLYPLIK